MKSIINATVFDYESYRPNSYILYDDMIHETGPMSAYARSADCTEELDVKGAIVMPSFVNGHAHIYSDFLRGWAPPLFRPLTFREHLQQVFWLQDAQMDQEVSYHMARSAALDHIRSGVTTIFDHHACGKEILGSLDALKKGWVDEAGLRALFCFELSDRFPVDECIRENVEFHDKHDGESNMFSGMFGMHASLTLSENTLCKVSEAIGQIPMHVHVAEGVEDEEECMAMYGKTIVERFADHKIITPNSVYAHCVHLSLREASIMKEYGVTAAMNTSSNMNGGNGIVEYRNFRRIGTRAMIGNDSMGTNLANDIRYFVCAQHLKAHNSFAVNEMDALNCLNTNYDQASRLLGVKLGRIREGYAADMMSIDYIPITPMNDRNAWSHIFDGVFQQFRPRNVWCAGQQKLKDYSVTMNEEQICSESRNVCQRLWDSVT